MIDRDLVPRFVSSSLIVEMKTGVHGKELVIYKSLYVQNIRLNGKHPRFLTVSSTQVHVLEVSAMILYTAPCLYSGLSLSLALVTGSRKVVIGLCAMRALEQCTV